MSRSSLAKIRTYRELPKTLGVEDATNGEGMSYGWWFDVDYGLQKPGLIYPNFFSLKKVKNGTHAYCHQLTISTASHQPSVFLNHVFICFSFFSDGSRYKSLVGGENEPEDENHMIGFRGCGRLPSSPWNWRWGNALVPLLSWPHVVVCCVWNWGVFSVEAESSEPESRWLQGFFCFRGPVWSSG